MRRLPCVCAAVALALSVSMACAAQSTRDDDRQSAASTRLADFGGFGGLDVRFGDVGDEFATFAGAEACLLMKRQIYLGIRGAGLATDNHHLPTSGGAASEVMGMGYGGFVLGYVIGTKALADVSVDVLLGGGGVGLRDSNRDEDWDSIFVFEPSVTADIKLASMVRVGIGAGYRFVGDAETAGISDADLRSLTGVFRVRVGWF